MKVLIVSKALIVAAYRGKLAELERLGFEVKVVVPPEWKEDGSKQRLEAGPSARPRPECELIVSPMRWNGHFHLHYYPQLPELIRRTQPDLVHLDEEPYNLSTYLGARAAGRRKIPSLFFTWQNILRRHPPPFAQMERSVYRLVAHALAGTETAASILRHRGYRGELTVVPQFGVDANVFRPDPLPHSGFAIGFLNRLTPAKGPLLTLEAFARLPADCRLCMVGDGPLRTRLEVQIDRQGLRDRVSVRSRVPSGEMPEVLQGLDAVVLPSLTTPRWKEQFGRILIEAMACGVPVVGSDSGEIPEVIGDAGLIVPEGNASVLARALQCLYDDRELREDLSRRGRRRVLERFTHAHVADLTAKAYRQALEPRRT